ncbi:hypothetical protein C1646_668781 [Rhizophagus diaphanus]|nr:hypothetical protein C1646_668781 [Rhizophagus diaphanus] [Rhizophagus sp. MUCL 43196]
MYSEVDRDSVNKNDKLLETFSTENDIKEKLGGVLIQPRLSLDEYFNRNNFKDKKSKSAIHIIGQLLTFITRSLEEALSIILPNLQDTINILTIQKVMPLKDRDTNKALEIFNDNITKSLTLHTGKLKFNFLVCSGAARIDENLDAATILGLRIAYKYFARGKAAVGIFQTLAWPYFTFFRIDFVLAGIMSHLNTQRLIMVLHIDEYQEILAFEKEFTGKRLLKSMLLTLGPFMQQSNKYYVQIFLSGIATRDVTKSFKPNVYSFTFVYCSLLSTKSILEIFDFFAKKEDREGHWMCNTRVLQLLYDTSGLPRALDTIIEECFKKKKILSRRKE